jgi:hypothetical protein
MPSSGRASPRAIAASAAFASASARSAVTVTNACMPGSSFSIRWSSARVSSTGESCFARNF